MLTAAMSPKVLIVEDSPTQALRMRIALEARGFDVVIVNESRQALPVAREERPDVILSDVRMPGWDGFELTRRFRDDPELGGTPIILNSATAHDEADRDRALELGAHEYIEKGLDPGVLASALTDALQ